MSTTPYIVHVGIYRENFAKTHVHDCVYFSSHFGQEMAQNADLPITCKNFSGATPPYPRHVLGHRAVLFPDSRSFGSHNFQIVPARLGKTGKYTGKYPEGIYLEGFYVIPTPKSAKSREIMRKFEAKMGNNPDGKY